MMLTHQHTQPSGQGAGVTAESNKAVREPSLQPTMAISDPYYAQHPSYSLPQVRIRMRSTRFFNTGSHDAGLKDYRLKRDLP